MTPNIYTLGNITLTGARTDDIVTEGTAAGGSAQSFIDRLAGASLITAKFKFVYGSGGTTCIARVQTAFGDDNWVDLIRVDFATASREVYCNITSQVAKALTALAALGSESLNEGLIGDRLRLVITSTGTYAGNTSLSAKVHVR